MGCGEQEEEGKGCGEDVNHLFSVQVFMVPTHEPLPPLASPASVSHRRPSGFYFQAPLAWGPHTQVSPGQLLTTANKWGGAQRGRWVHVSCSAHHRFAAGNR